IAAAILEIGRENFNPIASLGRLDLNHIRICLYAEEGENLQRMPVSIARLVGVAPLLAIDEHGQGRVRRRLSGMQGQAKAEDKSKERRDECLELICRQYPRPFQIDKHGFSTF